MWLSKKGKLSHGHKWRKSLSHLYSQNTVIPFISKSSSGVSFKGRFIQRPIWLTTICLPCENFGKQDLFFLPCGICICIWVASIYCKIGTCTPHSFTRKMKIKTMFRSMYFVRGDTSCPMKEIFLTGFSFGFFHSCLWWRILFPEPLILNPLQHSDFSTW